MEALRGFCRCSLDCGPDCRGAACEPMWLVTLLVMTDDMAVV